MKNTKIGILSKRTHMLTGKIVEYLEGQGHNVKIYTLNNLCINNSLLKNDFYILKSKKLFFLYAGYFLEANDIPVVPNPTISYQHKHRIEAHYLIKKAGLIAPNYYMGTAETLRNELNEKNYPFILKTMMGSGSRGVKVIKSPDEIQAESNEILYLEDFIEGTHYNVYFIDKEICTLKKPPLSNEHVPMEPIPTTADIKEYILKWKNTHNLLFGHLDIVRENSTKKLYVVDPGSFPEFTNWNCKTEPVSEICNLIINKLKTIK